MKLRIAKKIVKRVAESEGRAPYSESQMFRANQRYLRTRAAKEAEDFWRECVDAFSRNWRQVQGWVHEEEAGRE